MRNALLIAVAAGAVILAGCSPSGPNDHKLAHHAAMPDMPLYSTPGGVPYMAPEEVMEQEGWPDAMREIDLAVHPFRSGALKIQIAHIHFHPMGELTPDERAQYVGGGVIEACYHAERVPHTFCLSEAVRDLAADQNPTASPEYLDWLEAVASSWVGALYGLAERID